MELRMMELVSWCTVVASPGRNAFSAAGIDRFAMRPLPLQAKFGASITRIDRFAMSPVPWQAKFGASIKSAECGDRNCGGMVLGKIGGEEKEGPRIRGGLGRRHEWRRRNGIQVGFARTSNSVAEAPSSSEASNPEVGVSEQSESAAAGDVEEKRGQQGGGGGGGGGRESSSEDEAGEVLEKGFTMSRICDRLIEVFLTEKTNPSEWRGLLALSSEWVRIRPHFYNRCKAKAKAETVATRKRELNKLARAVKEVDDQMILHDAMLAEIEKNPFEIDVVVAKRRKEFTGGFFEHLNTLCDAAFKSNRRDEIASIAGKCLSLIEAYDAAVEDTEDINEAQLKFDNILIAPSLEAAANKIDQLARSKELDSTLLLLITKAWAAAKDSTTMNQEAKDIMEYIYKAAKSSMLNLIPDEIQILKHLLSIPDPRDRFAALTDAFAPGDELEEKNENKFHTTPDKLKHWMKKILDAYHANKRSTLMKEAQNLMNPEVISRLEVLLEYMDESFIV